MSIILDDTLVERRGKLALAVHTTYQDQLWKGSDAWRAHQVAKGALDPIRPRLSGGGDGVVCAV